MKVFNAPYQQTGLSTDLSVVPGGLCGGGVVFDFVVDVRADEPDVGVFEV